MQEEILNTSDVSKNLEVSFDVGHSSIGWAVLKSPDKNKMNNPEFPQIELLGCGVVTFEPDTCLAKKRRDYRRQRRHIRSTKMRIKRMNQLLEHLKVLTASELEKPGSPYPWKLAASVLQGKRLLNWNEIWDILRWYAHNRGYDENRHWSEVAEKEDEDDTESVKKSIKLMEKHKTKTMAETICKELGTDPSESDKRASHKSYKEVGAAFPRSVVVNEVREILDKHKGKLPGLSQELVETLVGESKDAWKTIPCPSINLPSHYWGSLLFGQLLPRFNNRNIKKCPFSGDTLPLKECVEFYRYRWGKILTNIRVSADGLFGQKRPLNSDERKYVDSKMRELGSMTKTELRKAVEEAVLMTLNKEGILKPGKINTNLETMFLTPEMEGGLVLDPVKKLINSDTVQSFWGVLPPQLQKRLAGKWRRGKQITIGEIQKELEKIAPEKVEEFNSAIKGNNKRKKKTENHLDDKIPESPLKMLKGRAPYGRKLLQQAYEEVLEGKDPHEKGGCLYRAENILKEEIQEDIEKQTNNHLVRHRLLILERLFDDIVKEYADNDKNKIKLITIEVNRDLREFSGMTAKEIESELNARSADFKKAKEQLEDMLQEAGLSNTRITATLIKKARIAQDLDFTCPYTGAKYELIDLINKQVDLEHIIPKSKRPSDSMESLVITFKEVNRWKGNRTALRFIKEEQNKPVPGKENLMILTEKRYQELVNGLNTKGHPKDIERKKKRKELLLMEDYVEEEFLPRDLTQTSQLVRLAVQVLKKKYIGEKEKPVFVSMPGSITGKFRAAWNLLGCLLKAVPWAADEDNQVKPKDELRNITHLHHAIDACVLALAAHFIPTYKNGKVWELMIKGTVKPSEKSYIEDVPMLQLDSENRLHIKDLPDSIKEQITERLYERRVVQHIPKDMSGVKCDETVYRVVDPNDNHPYARKLIRWAKEKNIQIPSTNDDTALIVAKKRRGADGATGSKILHEGKKYVWQYDIVKKTNLLGIEPVGGNGKLKRLKAAKLISENYGIALDPKPQIIRHFKVYQTIRDLIRDLKKLNNGKPPRILRKGNIINVPKGRYKGVWKITSIKDSKDKIKVNILRPQAVKNVCKTNYSKGNVLLRTLIKNGMQVIEAPYTGVNVALYN